MSSPGQSWNSLFQNVGGQGSQFNGPISKSGRYYAFLSKADLDETTGTFDVFFELLPFEWAENAILSGLDVDLPPPLSPEIVYHVPSADPSALLSMLGLKTADNLAEGSWYLLQLAPGTGGISGDLYDPNIDTKSKSDTE